MSNEEFEQLTEEEQHEAIREQFADMAEKWSGDRTDDRLCRAIIGSCRLLAEAVFGADKTDPPNPIILAAYNSVAEEARKAAGAMDMIAAIAPEMDVLMREMRKRFEDEGMGQG